jgi:hypothetical protein
MTRATVTTKSYMGRLSTWTPFSVSTNDHFEWLRMQSKKAQREGQRETARQPDPSFYVETSPYNISILDSPR